MRHVWFMRAIAVAIFALSATPSFGESPKEATVNLSVLIRKDGTVKDAKLDQSSGYPELDKAALEGIRKWRFKPGTVDDEPTEIWTRLKWTWRCKELDEAGDCKDVDAPK